LCMACGCMTQAVFYPHSHRFPVPRSPCSVSVPRCRDGVPVPVCRVLRLPLDPSSTEGRPAFVDGLPATAVQELPLPAHLTDAAEKVGGVERRAPQQGCGVGEGVH
jgi:hypothetical protein